MVTIKGQSRRLGLFQNAKEQSMLRKLYVKYILPYLNDYEFESVEDALHEIMVTPYRTLFMTIEGLHSFPQYYCHMKAAWKSG